MLTGEQIRTEFTFIKAKGKKITYELSIGYHDFNQSIGVWIFCLFPRPLGVFCAAYHALEFRAHAR